MEQQSQDPVAQEILSRAQEGVSEAKLRRQEASEHLQSGDYLAAVGALAGLDDRVRYVTTILTVLREWQSARNQSVMPFKEERGTVE